MHKHKNRALALDIFCKIQHNINKIIFPVTFSLFYKDFNTAERIRKIMGKPYVSSSVIKRLPRYYRHLGELKAEGRVRISSVELAKRLGFTASQIRQDLNCFGGFGQQGYGYNIEQLHYEIGNILGFKLIKKTVLIGAGNLARAIALHMGFEAKGFQLIGIFDKKESLVGETVKGLPIRHIDTLDEFCREHFPTTAILCIPKDGVKSVAEQLIHLGVRGFWNFSHYDLLIDHPEVVVENVHLGDSLMRLSYKIADLENNG